MFPVFFNLRLIFTYVLPPQRFCFLRVCLFVDVSAGLSAEFHKTTSQIPIKPRIDHDADSDKGMDPGTFSHFLYHSEGFLILLLIFQGIQWITSARSRDTGCNGSIVKISQCFSLRQAQTVRDVKIFKLYTVFFRCLSDVRPLTLLTLN